MEKDLIERLEKATGPDRELDNEIWILLGQPLPDDPAGWPTRYTESLDAALTLVPDMHEGEVDFSNPPIGRSRATVLHVDYQDPEHEGTGINPAIALCVAALKARGPDQ